MSLPFTLSQFLGVFQAYNVAIWPLQVLAYLLGLAMVYLIVKKTTFSNQMVSGGLTLMWLCVGLLYHITYFSTINKAAYIFGTVFVIQAIIFITFGIIKPKMNYAMRSDAYSYIGILFILYAMLIYPILGYFFGHVYPQSPVFGVTPCPVTIFTFGILLLSDRVPGYVIIIPFIWSLFGFSASSTLGITEDMGLVVAGLLGSAMIVYRQFKMKRSNILDLDR